MSLDYNYHSRQKIGFARPTMDHQLFIGEFYYRIREILKDTQYLVLTEEVFDKHNSNDLVPDVIVYDTLNDHYPVFLQKTDDIHPPKTVISVHFLYSLS